MNVGFIGLGAMGLPMAKNVIGGGYNLITMVHSNAEPGFEVQKMGAKLVGTPKEVAEASEVVITVLPADRQLTEVVLGPDGLKDGLSSGKVLIDMTTSKSSTLREIATELASMGVNIIDAPVSGGTVGAEKGELTIILGGETALIETWTPLLNTMGTRHYHCGPVGSGKVVKMVNQHLAAIHLLAIGEAFALGKKSDADLQVMYDVIRESSGYSKMMDLRLPGFLFDGEFKPGFKLDLMKKDVNLALDTAMESGIPLVFGALASQIMAASSASGSGQMDFSAAAEFLAKLAGESLKTS